MSNPNPKEAWAARRDPVVQRFLKKLIQLKVGASFITTAPSRSALYLRSARARKGRKDCVSRRFCFVATGAKGSGRFRVMRVQ